ncbi:hypothetical protein ACU8KH_05093 [Lachancea thermotolerans]
MITSAKEIICKGPRRLLATGQTRPLNFRVWTQELGFASQPLAASKNRN